MTVPTLEPEFQTAQFCHTCSQMPDQNYRNLVHGDQLFLFPWVVFIDWVCCFTASVRSHIHTSKYSRNSLRQTVRDPQNQFLLSDVLLIRIGLLHVHYYSKPNNAQKSVCAKQKFVLRVFVLMRFYCNLVLVAICECIDTFSRFSSLKGPSGNVIAEFTASQRHLIDTFPLKHFRILLPHRYSNHSRSRLHCTSGPVCFFTGD